MREIEDIRAGVEPESAALRGTEIDEIVAQIVARLSGAACARQQVQI